MKPESDDPNRVTNFNQYIHICQDAYLLNLSGSQDERLELLVNQPQTANEAIELLQSSYRKNEVIDSWSPLEIALFIAGITRFGRDWESIKSILPSKSAMELSQFYYSVWKGSKMYGTWKRLRKQRGLD
jgi:hypothetical protein